MSEHWGDLGELKTVDAKPGTRKVMSMVLSDGKALMQVSLWGAAAEIADGMLRRVWIAAKSFHS